MNLIFSGNIHTGGGVQVAVSFIQELVEYNPKELCSTDLWISSMVECELNRLSVSCSAFHQVKVVDFYGLNKPKGIRFDRKYNRCFVVFGPIYYSLNAKEYIVGFAQPWIAYANNDVYRKLKIVKRIGSRIKFFIQDMLFRRYDHLVVEHQHVKDALIKKGYSMPISVVSNSYASVFNQPENWAPLIFPVFNDEAPIVGFLGRAYPHKNLDILVCVNELLLRRYGTIVNFIFTLNENEMNSLGFDRVHNFYTTGPISLVQCPSFYQKIDALIFPSLLECFSATPIEAMVMRKPILTSDYPFVSEICHEAATYFDANNAEDIARAIYELFANPEKIALQIEIGAQLASQIPTTQQRAKAYWQCLTK